MCACVRARARGRLRKRLVTSESSILLFISHVSRLKYGLCLDNIVIFHSLFSIQIILIYFFKQATTKKYRPNNGKHNSSHVVMSFHKVISFGKKAFLFTERMWPSCNVFWVPCWVLSRVHFKDCPFLELPVTKKHKIFRIRSKSM
jgi:hypothetical protein